MSNPEHVLIVKAGAEAIDRWREANPDTPLDLSGADLRGANLRGALMIYTDLTGADLTGANLRGAYLRGADLRGAYLTSAVLRGAYLTDADLRGAYLTGADLRGAYLTHANIIDGGVDDRGYEFRATWGDGGNDLIILAGCRRWTSFDKALAWYGPDYSGDGNRQEIQLKLTYMRDLYLMRTGQLKDV